MFWFFYKHKLAAYIHGELDEKSSAKIKSLIDNNENYRLEYEMVKAGMKLSSQFDTSVSKPENEFENILSKMESSNESSKHVNVKPLSRQNKFYDPKFLTISAAAIILITLVAVEKIDFTTNKESQVTVTEEISPKVIDIYSYLVDVEQSKSHWETGEKLKKSPEGFEPSSWDESVKYANIADTKTNFPFDGFELNDMSIKWKEGIAIVGFNFQNKDDKISLYYTNNEIVFETKDILNETTWIGETPVKIYNTTQTNTYLILHKNRKYFYVSNFDEDRDTTINKLTSYVWAINN